MDGHTFSQISELFTKDNMQVCNTRTRGTLTRCHIRQLNHHVPSAKNCSLWHYFHLYNSTVVILKLFLFLLFWGEGVLFTEACWQKYLESENGLLWRDLIIHILILYFFKELLHQCIYFFPGRHYHNTFSISESQNQSTESLFVLIQMCLWSPWLIFLYMFVCMYVHMHVCVYVLFGLREKER